MQIALVIDMCFYFAGLAYRDRQVEKDKVLFEEKLKLQELESERAEAALRQQAVELEMQALRAQMNPHFIFNSLNSINRFILQNNKTQASEYLTKFSSW
jgi:LytS/YehU family sensor histidine kinase